MNVSGLTGSRADVDVHLDLVPNTPEQEQSARLKVADKAGQENWSVEETKEMLRALGLVESGLSPKFVGKGTQRKRVTNA